MIKIIGCDGYYNGLLYGLFIIIKYINNLCERSLIWFLRVANHINQSIVHGVGHLISLSKCDKADEAYIQGVVTKLFDHISNLGIIFAFFS